MRRFGIVISVAPVIKDVVVKLFCLLVAFEIISSPEATFLAEESPGEHFLNCPPTGQLPISFPDFAD